MRLGNIGVGILIAAAGAAFIGIGIAVQNHMMDSYSPVQKTEPAEVQGQDSAGQQTLSEASGDVNDDGEVNMFDLNTLSKYLSGAEESINEKNADMNGNGRVDNDDAALLKKFIMRKSVGE